MTNPSVLRASGEYKKDLTPEKLASFASRYHRQEKLPEQLDSSDAFNHYKGSRIKDIDGFGSVKLSDNSGKTLADKLAAATGKEDLVNDVNALQAMVATAFTLSPKTIKAVDNFNQELAAIHNGLRTKPPQYNTSGIATVLQRHRNTSEKTLTAQHQSEMTALNELFKPDSDFSKKLKRIGNVSSQTQMDELKKEFIDTLKKSQTDERKKFDELLEKEIKTIHQISQRETERLGFMHYIYINMSKKEQEKLNEIARKKRADQGIKPEPITIGDKFNIAPSHLFDDMNIASMIKEISPIICTRSGKKITVTYDDKGNSTNSFSLPPFLFNLFYYSSRFNNPLKSDLIALATKIKAEGNSQITIDIKLPRDDEFAMEIGRQAYEAALAAGFDPTEPEDEKVKRNITITVNGKPKTTKELFESFSQRLASGKSEANEENKQRQTLHNQKDFKEINNQAREHYLKQTAIPSDHRVSLQNNLR